MKENTSSKIPAHLLVLDFIGMPLLGIGLAEWLADTHLVPEVLRFDHYAIAMVISGAVLGLPLLFHLIGNIAGSAQNQ